MQYRLKKIDYTSPAAAQGGPGIQKQFTWYVSTPYINMDSDTWKLVGGKIGATIGDMWWLGGGPAASGGNAFMFVRAREALALGQLVAMQAPTTGTATVPGVPATTTAAVTTNISNVAAGVNGEVDNWIHVNATGATLPQIRRIKANSAAATGTFTVALPDRLLPSSPTDKDVFDTLATNGDAVNIIRPYNVIVNTATTVPVGVALGTVTSGNYTIIQVAGLAAVQAVGNGTALVVNQPAIGSAAGVIIGAGGNQGAAPVITLYNAAASMIPLYATAAAGPLLIPTMVNFIGQ